MMIFPSGLVGRTAPVQSHRPLNSAGRLLPATNNTAGKARRVPLMTPAAASATGSDQVQLGGSGISISPLGIGTRSWGDPTASHGEGYDEEDLSLVFETAIAGGCTFFDTDEMFGFQSLSKGQQAEQSLGKLAQLWDHPARPPIIIGTKYCPLPWANSFIGGDVRSNDPASVISALEGSLTRLGRQQVDLYYLQNPIDGNARVYMESFAHARDAGLVRAFGLCNHDKRQLEETLEEAEKLELPLAAAQVRYSIFHREAERDGVLDICGREGIAVIAHSPLDGRLGGGAEAVSKDEGSVLKLLEFIGAVGYKGKTSTQMALNYVMSKGLVPIPGCTKVEHAEEVLGAMGWSLDPEDVQTIDEKLTYHGY